MHLYWATPDDHPTASDLSDIENGATRAITLEVWNPGDRMYDAVNSNDFTCQVDSETTAISTIGLAQCVIAGNTDGDALNAGVGRNVTYQVKYDITSGTTIKGTPAQITLRLPLTADNAENLLPELLLPGDTEGMAAGLHSMDNPTRPKTAIDLVWQRNPNMANPPEHPTGYVIEYSEDAGVTWKILRNADRPRDLGTNTKYTHFNVRPGVRYDYRVFPWHSAYGLPKTIMDSSEPADLPQPVQNLRVTAVGEDALKLEWNLLPASQNGGHLVTGYLVQVSGDVNNDMTNDNRKATVTGESGWDSQDIDLDDTPPMRSTVKADVNTYPYKPTGADALPAGGLRWFRVFAITVENDGDTSNGGDELDSGYIGRGEASPNAGDVSAAKEVYGRTDSSPVPGETPPDDPPGAPMGLTSEPAHSNNLIARTDRGVLLLWNEPEQGSTNMVTSYVIQRQVVGVDTEMKPLGTVTWTGAKSIDERTSYVDREEPEMDEVRMYRVGAKNVEGTTWTTSIMYPATHTVHTVVLGKPTMVEAMSDAAGEVTVTWQPGMNADSHDVVLFSGAPDYNFADEEENVTGMSHTFTDLAAGRYAAVVISAMGDDMWDYSLVWVVVQ